MKQGEAQQGDTTPMQRAFSLFRTRVDVDPSISDDIKAAVAEDLKSANPEKFQALRGALLKRYSAT